MERRRRQAAVALGAAGVLLDGLARRTAGRIANAELLQVVTRPPAARAALALAWAYAGYHLFAF